MEAENRTLELSHEEWTELAEKVLDPAKNLLEKEDLDFHEEDYKVLVDDTAEILQYELNKLTG